MCLAVPVKIIAINGTNADIDIGGVKRQISIQLTPEAKPGDYALVHTGYAISLMNEEEAQETLEIFKKMAELDESD
jgi:hydrogenase expression/formation protein HypC